MSDQNTSRPLTLTFDNSSDLDEVGFGNPRNKLNEEWTSDHLEGQLAVDVMEIGNNIVILSTMAGAVADKIEVHIDNDLLTIRGERVSPTVLTSHDDSCFHQECFWGSFSRTVVLPVHVKGDLAKAEYKNGILKITVPKLKKHDRKIPIKIVED